MYVHACVWVRMYDVYICLYAVVCVREREREYVCVCVHACVWVRVYAVYMFICRVVCVREREYVCVPVGQLPDHAVSQFWHCWL